MIQKWFDIKIMHITKHDREEEDIGGVKNASINKFLKLEKAAAICDTSSLDDDLRAVQNVIKTVNEKPTPPMPVLLYVLTNVRQNLCVTCCCTTDTVSLLAAGVGNTIKLCGLTGRLKYNPASGIGLGCPRKRNANTNDIIIQETIYENSSISLYGHYGAVQDLAFLPRTKSPGVIISVSQDATMRTWRLDNYKCISTYRGHNNEIWCVDVSTLEMYVATGSRDKSARIWNLERSYPLRTCAGHLLDVECIKFHPNNLYFATGSADKTVRMWSVNDAKVLRLFCGHKGAVQALAFSPDGKYLASAGEDQNIRVWDISSGKLFKEYKGHNKGVISLSWSKNDEFISSCSLDGTVRLWDLHHQIKEESSSENAAGDELQCYTIGSELISIQHSKANSLVCIAVT